MTYSIDKCESKIQLFSEKFAKGNKNKCKIRINGKEYEIIDAINVKELKKYGIKKIIKYLRLCWKEKQ